jgi:hypothetical protein
MITRNSLPARTDRAPTPQRPTLPADHPKARLLRLLNDADGLQRIRQAAEILAPEAPLTVLRLVLFEAGFPAPATVEPAEFVKGCSQWGWRVFPAGLEKPQAGDLWVTCDEQRQPARLGFVAKPSVDGTWFLSVGAGPERERLAARAVDFWLRLPGGG